MHQALFRTPPAITLGLVMLLVAGCGASDDPPKGAKKLSFELTDGGCLPHEAKAPAGPLVFEAENTGTSAVTEIEVMEGDRVLGEKEDLTEGLSGSFTLTLDPGSYTIYCPNGSVERGTLTVTRGSKASADSRAERASVTG
jgi:iron uptake system component EfeO